MRSPQSLLIRLSSGSPRLIGLRLVGSVTRESLRKVKGITSSFWLAHPHSRTSRKLLSVGNPQAKSYALFGIRVLNSDRFKELSRNLRESKTEVVTQSGCIEYKEPLGTVLKHIEAAEYSKGAAAKPTVVEFWHVGDDGLSQRLAERVESEFERSPNFAIGSGKKPGTLVVTIPTNVEWKLVGERTQVFYNIEFATADDETISKSSGSC